MHSHRVILFPFGGNSREAVATIEAVNAQGGNIKICGFLDDNITINQTLGYPYLGHRSCWEKWVGKAKILAVPGNPSSYLEREALIKSLKVDESDWITIIDPLTRISTSATVGFNVLVQAHCYIGANAKVGNHCILLPQAVVSHDSVIGDFTMVGAHASISSNVIIGKNCYIGASSSFRQGIEIGDNALIGIGANVLKNVPAGAVVVGNPARILRFQY